MLRDYFYWVEDLPSKPDAYPNPEALYKSVNEPYTQYYNPEQAHAFMDVLDNKSVGLGIYIEELESGILIERVIEDSPAQKAGLMQGDTIIQIGDVAFESSSDTEFSQLLRGQEGDTKNLVVLRNGKKNISVVLAGYIAPSVFVDSLAPDVFQIQISSFIGADENSIGTAEELKPYLPKLKTAKVIILDLRHNGGGEVRVTLEIAGMFIGPHKALVKIEERDPQYAKEFANGIYAHNLESTGSQSLGDKSLYILMDGYSASASEILISGLTSHYPDITTVGSPSYGKGRGQVIFYNPPQFAGLAKITAMVINPVEGESYDEVGIPPQVELNAGDNALDYVLAEIDDSVANAKLGGKSLRHPLVKLDSFQWEPLLYLQN